MEHSLDDLAFRLFKRFAQYEYALKVMGFRRSIEGGGVLPDWDRFANERGRVVFAATDPAVTEACAYIMNTPPKKQVLSDGQLAWEEVRSEDRSPQTFFGHLRRIRNNLYHGGKFNGVWFAPDRSRELMTHALAVLEYLPTVDSDLESALSDNMA